MDIKTSSKDIIELKKYNKKLKVILFSEEPLWDLCFGNNINKKVIYHSRKQLRFYEEQARKTLKATMNEIKCFQTPDQRKEHKRLYMREYHKRKKLEKENKENNIS